MGTTYNEQISFSVQLLSVSGTGCPGYFMKKPQKEIRELRTWGKTLIYRGYIPSVTCRHSEALTQQLLPPKPL